jgi:hypothetical protein
MYQEIRRLHEIGSKGARLDKASVSEAKSLMIGLRKLGFSNMEISLITRGRWSLGTVKKYMKGVKAVSSEMRDRVWNTFSEFVDKGRTVEEVEDFQVKERYLLDHGTSIEQLVEFMIDSFARNVDLSELFARARSKIESIYSHFFS